MPSQVEPPLAGPGLRRHFHRLALEAVGRIARYGVEAPHLLAGFGVVGTDVTAINIFGTGITDENLAVGDARRTGDGVELALVGGDCAPHFLAGGGIECDQAAVINPDIDFAVPHGDTTVDDVAATTGTEFAGDFRVVSPQQLAGFGIVGTDLAPGLRDVQRAIHHQRCRFLAAIGIEIGEPGQTEVLDVVRRDLRQLTVALLLVGAAVGHPLARFLFSVIEPLLINPGCRRCPRLGCALRRGGFPVAATGRQHRSQYEYRQKTGFAHVGYLCF